MNQESVILRPRVAWPRQLSVGQRYLVTVELEHSNIESWPYDDEEYPITCVLAGDPDVEIRAVGSPIAMLHRFGGTYGPVRFIVSASHQYRRAPRSLALTLLSAGGVPIRSDNLQISTVPQDSHTSDGESTASVWFSRGDSVPPVAEEVTQPTDESVAADPGLSTPPPAEQGPSLISVKMIIAGGFGSGKTTAIGSVSEIMPLTSEGIISMASAGVDDLTLVPDKITTTTSMDFAMLNLETDLRVYLFGTPGTHRFWFLWDELARGAVCAIVVVDTRRIVDCFPAIDYFEDAGLPYIVAVNTFDGLLTHSLEQVREAVSVANNVPVIAFDARSRDSVRDCLVVAVENALRALRDEGGIPPAER